MTVIAAQGSHQLVTARGLRDRRRHFVVKQDPAGNRLEFETRSGPIEPHASAGLAGPVFEREGLVAEVQLDRVALRPPGRSVVGIERHRPDQKAESPGLEDVEVRERLFYDATQIAALIRSELP